MDLDKLFKLIRKEQTVLWAGSGLSKYAGYPMAGKLAELLYDDLTEAEKKHIKPGLSLPDMAEEFVRCNCESKNELIRKLQYIYSKAPLSLKYHKVLAAIPQIKSIITTNYDSLFELAYGSNAQIIYNDLHIPYLQKFKIEVFKAHGHLSDPNSIIITKSDYDDFFFNAKGQSLYWNVLSTRIATNNIIFIGYGLEDGNVSNLFKKIDETIQNNRLQKFFISPSVPNQKKNYLAQRGIQVLEIEAEKFILELYKNVRKNIKNDCEKGWISSETLNNFASSLKLKTEVSFGAEDNKRITLNPKAGKAVKGIFRLSYSQENIEFDKKFSDFVTGRKLDDFELDFKELKDLQLSMAGIDIIDFNGKQTSLILGRIPSSEGLVKIVFEDYLEFANLTYKIFSTVDQLIIKLRIIENILTIKAAVSEQGTYNLNFEYHVEAPYKSVNNALFHYKFLQRLYTGMPFTVFFGSSQQGVKTLPTRDESKFEVFERFIGYFDKLKELELLTGLYFKEISESDVDYALVEDILQIMKYREIERDWVQTLQGKVGNEQELINIEKIINEGYSLFACNGGIDNVKLHGIDISLGYSLSQINDPVLIKSTKNSLTFEIASKRGRIVIQYSDEPFDFDIKTRFERLTKKEDPNM